MIYTQDYWKLPPRIFALHISGLTEADFAYLCDWVTRRVPDALVWNVDGGWGEPVGEPDEPFVWGDLGGVKITHPDHPDFVIYNNVGFVDGWFREVTFGYARYPHEWGTNLVDAPYFPPELNP